MKATVTATRAVIVVGTVAVLALTGIVATADAGSQDKPTKKGLSQKTTITGWVAPTKAASVKNPLGANAKAIKAGKATYEQICFVCHGSKGKGDGMAAVSLKPKPADFSSERVRAQTDGELFWKMTEGRGAMASYKNMLKEKQRWELVNYIRELGKAGQAKAKE